MDAKAGIQFGCQFYTWQMSGDKYRGKLDHITGVVKQAGFTGIEPEVGMLGRYADAALLQDLLSSQNLALGALTMVCDWLSATETDSERELAATTIDILGHFPAAQLVLCQMPGADRNNLRQRQENALRCMGAVAHRAAEKGISCAFHPNSPSGSIFRTAQDYEILLQELNPLGIGFVPDSGHILKGGMDVYSVFSKFSGLIRHVHFKDIDSRQCWVGMGKGITDFSRLLRILKEQNFCGWVMIEEESDEAQTDPDAATLQNGIYIKETTQGGI